MELTLVKIPSLLYNGGVGTNNLLISTSNEIELNSSISCLKH